MNYAKFSITEIPFIIIAGANSNYEFFYLAVHMHQNFIKYHYILHDM